MSVITIVAVQLVYSRMKSGGRHLVARDPRVMSGDRHLVARNPRVMSGGRHLVARDPCVMSSGRHLVARDPCVMSSGRHLVARDPRVMSGGVIFAFDRGSDIVIVYSSDGNSFAVSVCQNVNKCICNAV